ncbi:MAG: hypothetical protein M9927_07755 [Anaerolineae bacterium]|nr:hypothetical protein [Anaerolineae bacterium]
MLNLPCRQPVDEEDVALAHFDAPSIIPGVNIQPVQHVAEIHDDARAVEPFSGIWSMVLPLVTKCRRVQMRAYVAEVWTLKHAPFRLGV